MKKILCILLACMCLFSLCMCGIIDENSSNPAEEINSSSNSDQGTEIYTSDEKSTQEETSQPNEAATKEESEEPNQTGTPGKASEADIASATESPIPGSPAPQEQTPEPTSSAVQTATPSPTSTKEPVSTKKPAPTYTYTDMNQTMYAKQSVNVRDQPTTDGKKLGGLSSAQEVTVTGQCNETNWYQISYNGNSAFVSNKYLTAEKPVAKTPKPTQSATASNNSNKSSTDGNQGSNGNSQSGESSVTVPKTEETGANLVWVPVHGGTKYHSHSSCSNMKDPIQVSVETAIANGYEPCKKCY